MSRGLDAHNIGIFLCLFGPHHMNIRKYWFAIFVLFEIYIIFAACIPEKRKLMHIIQSNTPYHFGGLLGLSGGSNKIFQELKLTLNNPRVFVSKIKVWKCCTLQIYSRLSLDNLSIQQRNHFSICGGILVDIMKVFYLMWAKTAWLVIIT